MNDVATDFMTIGQFARRSRLSLKALRLYDELGLLPPAHIDPVSGYRYYREVQFKKARLIMLLRRIDMPLTTIADILAGTDEQATDLLMAYWQGVEETVTTNRRIVTYLREYQFGTEKTMKYEIKTRDVPAQTVLTTSREVYAKDLPPFIQSAIGKLIEHISDQGGQVSAPPEAIFHGQVDEDNNGPVEIAVPYTGEVVPADGFTLKTQPARQEAYTTLTMKQLEFPEILKVYDAVGAWLEENGKTPAGSPREVYFGDDMDSESGAPFCDIAWPFR